MDKTDSNNSEENLTNLVPFEDWLKSIGKGRVTGWNWRKQGVIKAVNIFGRIYVTRAEIARFEERASSGEFATVKRKQIPQPRNVKNHPPARRFSLRALLKGAA
jgi:hypothetical protein